MGSEYFINNQELENKVRQLLPSQGGAGAGFDLSASTQIIPIIDLTESAEGSNLREDLQTAFSLSSITAFNVVNTTTTLVTTTGYFRVFGTSINGDYSGSDTTSMDVTDGTTTKLLFNNISEGVGVDAGTRFNLFDFVVLLQAGDSLRATSSSVQARVTGTTRQIASLDGTLVNP